MDEQTIQLWIRVTFIPLKLVLILFLVVICIISGITISQNWFILLIFIPSFVFLIANGYLFKMKINENALKEEWYMFMGVFMCYTTIFLIIYLFGYDKSTKANGPASQGINESIQTTANETFSYSIEERLNRTENSQEATKNLSIEVLKYEEDDLSNQNINEDKNSFIIKIYIILFILAAVIGLFQSCTYLLVKNIKNPVQELNETSNQNNDIPMQPLAPAVGISELGPNINEGPLSVPHRTQSALVINILGNVVENVERRDYDSVSVSGHPMAEAGLRTLPLEREKFHPRNNLSSSAATNLNGDSLQRRSVRTTSELSSRGIIPE